MLFLLYQSRHIFFQRSAIFACDKNNLLVNCCPRKLASLWKKIFVHGDTKISACFTLKWQQVAADIVAERFTNSNFMKSPQEFVNNVNAVTHRDGQVTRFHQFREKMARASGAGCRYYPGFFYTWEHKEVHTFRTYLSVIWKQVEQIASLQVSLRTFSRKFAHILCGF